MCPAPPSPSVPVTLGCSYVEAASVSAELELSLTFTAGYPVHEGFSGTAQLHWVDPSDNEGEAEVPWRYSADRSFLFTLPLEARYADHFDVKAWDFTDACGFPFAAGTDLQVTSDGQGNWYCGPPG